MTGAVDATDVMVLVVVDAAGSALTFREVQEVCT